MNFQYCVYCEKQLLYDRTKDHIIPKSKGGDNSSYNLAPCCSSCNTLKSNMMPAEFSVFLKQKISKGGYRHGKRLYGVKELKVMLLNNEGIIQVTVPYTDELREKDTKSDILTKSNSLIKQTIIIRSDDNELTFSGIKKGMLYTYLYTRSITKLGMNIDFTEEQLIKLINTNP